MIVKQKIKKRSTIHYLQSFESRFWEKEKNVTKNPANSYKGRGKK